MLQCLVVHSALHIYIRKCQLTLYKWLKRCKHLADSKAYQQRSFISCLRKYNVFNGWKCCYALTPWKGKWKVPVVSNYSSAGWVIHHHLPACSITFRNIKWALLNRCQRLILLRTIWNNQLPKLGRKREKVIFSLRCASPHFYFTPQEESFNSILGEKTNNNQMCFVLSFVFFTEVIWGFVSFVDKRDTVAGFLKYHQDWRSLPRNSCQF